MSIFSILSNTLILIILFFYIFANKISLKSIDFAEFSSSQLCYCTYWNLVFHSTLKNKKLSLKESIELLLEIHRLYLISNIEYNIWELLPLEYMEKYDYELVHRKINSAPIPIEKYYKDVEVSYSFSRGPEYESRYCYREYAEPLWKKYKRDFKELGIEVLTFDRYFDSTKFNICINLADISDLPIDYEKIKMVSKQEMDEIIKKEEENERDG